MEQTSKWQRAGGLWQGDIGKGYKANGWPRLRRCNTEILTYSGEQILEGLQPNAPHGLMIDQLYDSLDGLSARGLRYQPRAFRKAIDLIYERYPEEH